MSFSDLSALPDFSLYVLDIAKNSVRAGAGQISIQIDETDTQLQLSIQDDGCGMTEKQIALARTPGYTTRKTRSVGMGLPLLIRLAESTGGEVFLTSSPSEISSQHGTTVQASFQRSAAFIPMGDLAATVTTLIQGNPEIQFIYTHSTANGCVYLSTEEIHSCLGDEISLAEPEILSWIYTYLRKQYENPAFQ